MHYSKLLFTNQYPVFVFYFLSFKRISSHLTQILFIHFKILVAPFLTLILIWHKKSLLLIIFSMSFTFFCDFLVYIVISNKINEHSHTESVSNWQILRVVIFNVFYTYLHFVIEDIWFKCVHVRINYIFFIKSIKLCKFSLHFSWFLYALWLNKRIFKSFHQCVYEIF